MAKPESPFVCYHSRCNEYDGYGSGRGYINPKTGRKFPVSIHIRLKRQHPYGSRECRKSRADILRNIRKLEKQFVAEMDARGYQHYVPEGITYTTEYIGIGSESDLVDFLKGLR